MATPSRDEIRGHLRRNGYRWRETYSPCAGRTWVAFGRDRWRKLTTWQGVWEHLLLVGEVKVPNQEDGVDREYKVAT